MLETIERNELDYAHNLIKGIDKGERISGIIRGVSASGLTHYVSLVYPSNKGVLQHLTYAVGLLTGHKVSDYKGHNVIKMHGGGYDKVFQLVYELGLVVHSDGYYFKSDLI